MEDPINLVHTGLVTILALLGVIITQKTWIWDGAYITFRTVDNLFLEYNNEYHLVYLMNGDQIESQNNTLKLQLEWV